MSTRARSAPEPDKERRQVSSAGPVPASSSQADVRVGRIIHQIWVGGPIPKRFDAYRASWARLHPGWDIRLWTDDNLPTLVNQDIYDRVPQLVPEPNVGQCRADIVRYEILWHHGGVYLDIDFEALKPIDTLLDGVECFAAWEIQDEWIANGFMGATPQHPFIGRLIEQLPASVEANRGKTPNFSSGPRWFTAMHRKYDEMTVLPTRLIYPYTYYDMIDQSGREHPPWPDECYMVHHWNNFRRVMTERRRKHRRRVVA